LVKLWLLTNKEAIIIILALILTSIIISIRPFDVDVEVIISFKGEPTTSLAIKYGISLNDSIIKKASEDKLFELEGNIKKLQSSGIPLRVVSYMYTVIFGAVIEIPQRFIRILNQTGTIASLEESTKYKLDLENSVKMVDANRIWELKDALNSNVTGKGIKVAVIDTGVNYSQPILGGGIGPNYKVVGGYDFVDKDNDPMDIDGHGTAVAAIIAGKDDRFTGMAPDASILAYRAITEVRETSTAAIVQAINRAVLDGANVINISLGSAVSDAALGIAINHAVDAGIVVVAAAGNSGPSGGSIDYPSALNDVISVGASSNIGSSLLKADFTIPEIGRSFEAIPMNNTISTNKPLTSKLVYVGLGGKDDVANLNLKDAIAVAKRGTYFFSEKAKNVQEKGAVALIVFNNVTQNFVGILKDPVSIPVASISGADGEYILNSLLTKELTGNFTINSNPYQVVWFSSRGPASQFYLKPNLIAPGYDVETADYQGGYQNISGTSFAAPHVTGAVALIKQERPKLNPYQIMSLLMDNAEPLTTGVENYPVDVQGAGLMQVYNTIISDFVVLPGSLVFHLSPFNQTRTNRTLQIVQLSGENLNIKIAPDWSGPDSVLIRQKDTTIINGSAFITIEAQLNTQNYGTYYGWLNISSGKNAQRIPIKVQVNPVGISIIKDDVGQIAFRINLPKGFMSARALIQMPDGNRQTISYRSNFDNITFQSTLTGEYWISVLVSTTNNTQSGFNIVTMGRSTTPPEITIVTTLPQSLPIGGIPYQALGTIVYTLTLVVISITIYGLRKKTREKTSLSDKG
jgi:minor extracellular serine protease Vpr